MDFPKNSGDTIVATGSRIFTLFLIGSFIFSGCSSHVETEPSSSPSSDPDLAFCSEYTSEYGRFNKLMEGVNKGSDLRRREAFKFLQEDMMAVADLHESLVIDPDLAANIKALREALADLEGVDYKSREFDEKGPAIVLPLVQIDDLCVFIENKDKQIP